MGQQNSSGEYMGSGRTMEDILVFQIDAVRGDTYTMSETHSLSRSFGHGLLSLGAQPGDVVGVILPNMPEYAVVMLGASEAALVVTTLNPTYTPSKKQIWS